MSSKKNKKNFGNKRFPIAESVSIALKIQLDKFLSDENETELKFPTFLSAQERGFIHETVAKLGLKSKSRGKGVNRYLTIYKRLGSTIIQNDAKLILDSNMRCSIAELYNAFPITSKEKEDLSCCPEKERSPQLAHKALGQLNNGVAQVPNTTYNPDLIKFREKLPVYEQRAELINAICHNQVVIVAGATGCGKTTQLPQLVLEHCGTRGLPARVFVTQPRRISAVSVAERVAHERQEKIGQSVGYQIRLESRVSPRTVLTYCTNGVLLRTLMAGEHALASVTHVFVDEVHERDKFSDFLLIALRDALPRHRDLKLILMSATMDTAIFSRYFNDCPVLNVPGRLFEVQRYYLEDVLRLTGYRSAAMRRAERELRAAAAAPDSSYYAHLEEQKAAAVESVGVSGGGGAGGGGAGEPLDADVQADMDEFLDECFNEGSADAFSQVVYMFMSEGVPLHAAHSRCGRTALMAAAARGLTAAAAQLLAIGADPLAKDKAGKTAHDHAAENGHSECAALLAAARPAAAPAPVAAAADDLLLDAYSRAVPPDLVDRDLLLALVRHIHLNMPRGSILVFLPGYDDIVALRDAVLACAEMAALEYQVFVLHGNMQTLDQKRVFGPLPGARKIIISTNIAETSITIDDVVYVVDSCRVKEKYYEPGGGVCSLQCVWASRACCAQRAGRAGRTQPGRCWHLCSRRRFAALPLTAVPEILRVPLQELCLHTKLLAPGTTPIADFLSRALEPPSFLAVRNAVALLKTIGALTPTEDLTEIGRHLLDLTVEPKLGKMLLYACVLKCLDPVLTIVCSLANREPFQISGGAEGRGAGDAARREFAADSYSDHMALLRAFQAWQSARASGTERAFCARNLVCGATMETVVGHRAQLLAQLRAIGLVKARGPGDIKDVNLNSEKWHVVKAVLVSGLYPSVARVDRDSGTLRTSKEVRVRFHPKSILRVAARGAGGGTGAQALPTDWVVFEEISRVGRFCSIRTCTLVTPLTVALFGGPLRLGPGALTQRANPPGLSSDSDSEAEAPAAPDAAVLALDDWTAFAADAGDALAVYYLRQKLCALVVRRMANPARPPTPLDEQILGTVVAVLGAEERNAGLHQPAGIGQRPRPLTVDAAGWRARPDDHRGDFGGPQHPGGYGAPRPAWRAEAPSRGFSPQPPCGPGSPGSPDGRTLLANIEKYARTGDAAVRYFVARADDAAGADAVQSSPAQLLSAAMARKLQKLRQEGQRAVVFVSCAGAGRFVGAATAGEGGAEWLSTAPVPFGAVRHVLNALAGGARAVDARDGAELCAHSGRALLRAFHKPHPAPAAPRRRPPRPH